LVHRDGSLTFQRLTPPLAQTNFWPHRRGVNDVAFAPDGSFFATAGREGIAKLWDSATLRKIDDLKGHSLSMIRALDISPDGRRLATAAGGKEAIKLWDIRTRQELMTLGADSLVIPRLEFSRDGNKLVGSTVSVTCTSGGRHRGKEIAGGRGRRRRRTTAAMNSTSLPSTPIRREARAALLWERPFELETKNATRPCAD